MDRRRPFGARWERARETLETTILPAVTLRDRFFVWDFILPVPWTRGEPSFAGAAEGTFVANAGGKAVDFLADPLSRKGDSSYHAACNDQSCTAMLRRVCDMDGVEHRNDPDVMPASLWHEGDSFIHGGDLSPVAVLWTRILFPSGVVSGVLWREPSKK